MTADQSDLDFINIAEFFVNNQKHLDVFRSALHELESSDPEELRESFEEPSQKDMFLKLATLNRRIGGLE